MSAKFGYNKTGRKIASKGDTLGKDGEGRRIIVNNFPPGTRISEIEDFFGRHTIEGVTLFEHIAFIQFVRPQHHTDALLKNLGQFKTVKIQIKNYKPQLQKIKKEPARRRSRSPHSRPPPRAIRSRSRSRSPRREHGRRIPMSSSGDRRRAITDVSPPRGSRYHSPSRGSRNVSPSRSSRNHSLVRSSRHSSPRQDRQSRPSNSVEYSHSHSQSRQLVIRAEAGPMAGIVPQKLAAPSSSFSFGANSIPISTFPGCVSQPQARPFIPAPSYTSPENKPGSNLGRIFSEDHKLQVAIVSGNGVPSDQLALQPYNGNGSSSMGPTGLPAHIELLMKLIIEQKSARSLSTSQLKDLEKYFADERRQIELEYQSAQMPQASNQPNASNGDPTSPRQANSSGRSDHEPARETEGANATANTGESKDETSKQTDTNGDSENEIATKIANKIRRLNGA